MASRWTSYYGRQMVCQTNFVPCKISVFSRDAIWKWHFLYVQFSFLWSLDLWFNCSYKFIFQQFLSTGCNNELFRNTIFNWGRGGFLLKWMRQPIPLHHGNALFSITHHALPNKIMKRFYVGDKKYVQERNKFWWPQVFRLI